MIVGDLHPPDACEVALRIVDRHPLCAPMAFMTLTIRGPMLYVSDVL